MTGRGAYSARFGLGLALTLALALALGGTARSETIVIGTGGQSGVYFPAGEAICGLLNRDRAAHGISCTVEPTGGTIDNLRGLRAGRLQVGFVQSDLLHHALEGTGRFAPDGPDPNLRRVIALHAEPFTLLARADAGIASFEDLAGKRVNLGNPGSGQSGTMDIVMQAMGWDMDVFSGTFQLPPADQAQALCDRRLDAIVYTVGHPSAAIQQATTLCDTVLVPVETPAIRDFVARQPQYHLAMIPGGMYRGNPADTPTFGVTAMLVTSAQVSDYALHNLVKAVFEDLARFTLLHPALDGLQDTAMVAGEDSAPLHPGALRYFREEGLLP